MARLRDFIASMRPHQWYKNLLVFAAIVFSKHFMILSEWKMLICGFAALCMISSSVYVFNDMVDRKRDRSNPEKANRPIASGRMSIPFASVFAVLLFSLGMYLSYLIEPRFALVSLGISMLSLLYSVCLKNILFADLIAVSFNFVLRAVAGAVIISVYISPWLVVGFFFLALYLVTGKRYSEARFLSIKASRHRSTLGEYSKDMMLSLFNIFLAVLIVVFAIFSFSAENTNLMWATPLFVYVLLRYYYLILHGSIIARSPEKAFKDTQLLISSLLFMMLSIALIIW